MRNLRNNENGYKPSLKLHQCSFAWVRNRRRWESWSDRRDPKLCQCEIKCKKDLSMISRMRDAFKIVPTWALSRSVSVQRLSYDSRKQLNIDQGQRDILLN